MTPILAIPSRSHKACVILTATLVVCARADSLLQVVCLFSSVCQSGIHRILVLGEWEYKHVREWGFLWF